MKRILDILLLLFGIKRCALSKEAEKEGILHYGY